MKKKSGSKKKLLSKINNNLLKLFCFIKIQKLKQWKKNDINKIKTNNFFEKDE